MLESRPSPTLGRIVGVSVIIAFLLADAGLILFVLGQPISPATTGAVLLLLISLPVILFIAYWTSSLSHARYHVVGDSLVIDWGQLREVIPLAQIESLLTGKELAQVRNFRGLRWPGYFVGRGQAITTTRQAIPTTFFATRPLPEQLLLVTDSKSVSISPVDMQNFQDCLQALLESEIASPAVNLKPNYSLASWTLWRDKLALVTVTASIGLNALLFVYLSFIYNRLPEQVPLHFDQLGAVDRLGAPANLFVLPVAGALAWLTNGVLGWLFYQIRSERLPAYVLWSGALAIQFATWAALVGLLA